MAYTNTIKSIAIGSFDGIHLAHRTLIDQVEALVIIERNGGYLTPGVKRSEFTDKVCCFYHFEGIKGLSPEGFVFRLKEDFPALERIVVGFDFHFGKDKKGSAETLKSLFDGEVIIVDEVSVEHIPVHSRTIKTYIKEGNIAMANLLLGRDYCIEGEIIKGQGLGKKELVPTLNLLVEAYVLPKEGVYATLTQTSMGIYKSVSFLGHRVSTDGAYAVETHLLGEEIGEIEGSVRLTFVDFLRNNQKFDSLEALKLQIDEDIALAERRLR